MNLLNTLRFSPSFTIFKTKLTKAPRQRAFLSTFVFLILPACSITDLSTGIIPGKQEFKGIAVADDPHATLAAKDVLQSGGNAFDAATAMAFTMAVTLPSRAGIGSSGICQVYNPEAKTSSLLNFVYQGENTSYALPAMPRAMMALHAKGGKWHWESVLLPAEKIAKQGFAISQTLETDGKLFPEKFKDKNGNPLKAGDMLIQQDLASTIALLRSKGVAGLYTAGGAKHFMDTATVKNITFTAEELRDFVPKWETPKEVSFGNETVYLLTESLTNKDVTALWKKYQNNETVSKTTEKMPVGAGFAVADAYGNAITCNFSMGDLFGTRTELSGTGIILAKPLKMPTDDLATIMVVNNNVNEFRYAGYASSFASSEDMLQTALQVLQGKEPLQINFETAENIPANSGAISCPKGLPTEPASCTFAVDNRASGYGYRVGEISD